MPVLFSINMYIEMLSFVQSSWKLCNMFLYITDRQSAKRLKLKNDLNLIGEVIKLWIDYLDSRDSSKRCRQRECVREKVRSMTKEIFYVREKNGYLTYSLPLSTLILH